jgi:hypothetical protein
MDAFYLLDEALEHAVKSAEEIMASAAVGLVAATPENRRAAAAHWVDWADRVLRYQLRLASVRHKMKWAIEWCTK